MIISRSVSQVCGTRYSFRARQVTSAYLFCKKHYHSIHLRPDGKTTLPLPKGVPRKLVPYPERLLIYHAGTGRIVFIGCLKVTTIFVFGFFCAVVAPSYYFAPDEPLWKAGVSILAGLVPLLFVYYTTKPYVSYIHLRLPAFARYSKDSLLRYSRMLPKDTTLDITTMNIMGKPRVSRVNIVDLYPVKAGLSLANFARDTNVIEKRPWWAGRAIKRFAIAGGSQGSREPGVWDNIKRSVEKSFVANKKS